MFPNCTISVLNMLCFCPRNILKRISKRCLYYTVFVGIFWVLCYQLYAWKVVTSYVPRRMDSNPNEMFPARLLVRGVRQYDAVKYKPNENGKFVCFDTKKEIEYSHVNDDYCDCASDGSDEPGTNACSKGKFYCEAEINEVLGFLPSGRVNDGICDCCDGSDEWAQKFPQQRLSEKIQVKLGMYQSPCPNLCPEDV